MADEVEWKIPEEKLLLVIPVHAEAIVWLGVIGNIQVALRHPGNVGPNVKMMREFGRAIIGKLTDEKVLTEAQAQEAYMEFFVV